MRNPSSEDAPVPYKLHSEFAVAMTGYALVRAARMLPPPGRYGGWRWGF